MEGKQSRTSTKCKDTATVCVRKENGCARRICIFPFWNFWVERINTSTCDRAPTQLLPSSLLWQFCSFYFSRSAMLRWFKGTQTAVWESCELVCVCLLLKQMNVARPAVHFMLICLTVKELLGHHQSTMDIFTVLLRRMEGWHVSKIIQCEGGKTVLAYLTKISAFSF